MFQHNQLIDAIISPILYLLELYQSKNINEDRDIGLFFQMPVQIHDSLIVMCKKKARETHRVKTEKIKIQTAKRLGKKNALKYQQLVQTLAKFKVHRGYTNNSHHLYSGKRQRRPSTSLRKLALRTSRRNL